MKLILGSHWTTPPEGWVALSEQEQDITKRLQWEDASVDQIFIEHCHEHISFIDGVGFLKEALRVLKPNGVLRIVGPFVESLCSFRDTGDPLSQNFIKTQVSHYYKEEFELLKSMGINPYDDGRQFFLDSLFKGHNHKMIWSADLLSRVIKKVGFGQAYIGNPGNSYLVPEEDMLERRIRGLNIEELKVKGVTIPELYDPESQVVEAIKIKTTYAN